MRATGTEGIVKFFLSIYIFYNYLYSCNFTFKENLNWIVALFAIFQLEEKFAKIYFKICSVVGIHRQIFAW